MELEIVQKRENPLLKRVDVEFRVEHAGEKTPQRGAVRDKLAAATGAKTASVVITRMRSKFGQAVTEGSAKLYESVEVARTTEVPHLLKRHGLDAESEAAKKAKSESGEGAQDETKTGA